MISKNLIRRLWDWITKEAREPARGRLELIRHTWEESFFYGADSEYPLVPWDLERSSWAPQSGSEEAELS